MHFCDVLCIPLLSALITVSKAVLTVNQVLSEEDCDSDKLYTCLSAPQLAYDNMMQDCSQQYLDKLKYAKADKSEKGVYNIYCVVCVNVYGVDYCVIRGSHPFAHCNMHAHN